MEFTKRNINEQELRNIFLWVLSDGRVRKIIASTIEKPLSVMDIVKKCDIPHTTAYRLVNELRDKGVLIVERYEITEDGKKYALYRSTVKGIKARFEDGDLEIIVIPNDRFRKDIIDRAFELFFSIGGEK